jgi:hypothetical protein
VKRALFTVAMVGGVLLCARAMNGVAPRTLTFSGTLHGVVGPSTLDFTFKRAGVMVCAPEITVRPTANGHFVTRIPTDGCPDSLFDGSDITVSVAVNNQMVATDQPIGQVPAAHLTDSVAAAECPTGYDRDPTASDFVLCKKGADQVVRVGQGQSQFWIDRFEASLWQNTDGTGVQYGTGTTDDYPVTFPANGQWATPVYAVSKEGVRPSAFVSWFRANSACRLSGKRLPHHAEWLLAARGTADPTTVLNGVGGSCVVNQPGGTRQTGQGTNCVSAWGAEDMIGNVMEWALEWYGAQTTADPITSALPWPAGFGSDAVSNVASSAVTVGAGTGVAGAPAALRLGGHFRGSTDFGLFFFDLNAAPSYFSDGEGVRCVLTR